jgi:hypothetical protein
MYHVSEIVWNLESQMILMHTTYRKGNIQLLQRWPTSNFGLILRPPF